MQITVNIATHKARLPFLKKTFEALSKSNTLPDAVNIYFNDVKVPDWIPDFLPFFQVNAISGDDLGASAKFYNSELQKEGVYITLDDDIIPDPGYVGYITDSAMRYPNCIVGFHGTLYQKHPIKKYYEGGQTLYFNKDVKHDTAVDMLGTGCLAFRAALKNKPTLSDFPEKNACDPYLCKKAKDNQIPLVCLSRKAEFLKEIEGSQDSAIWKKVDRDDTGQTKVINSIKQFTRLYERQPIDTSKFGKWSIEWPHFKEILSVIGRNTKVVEFGSGESTKVLSKVGDLVSFEHDSGFRNELTSYRPLDNGWYGLTPNDEYLIKEADVIIIDGPTASAGRYNLPKKIIDLFKKDSIIFVDDCQRQKDIDQAYEVSKLTKKKLNLFSGKEKLIAKIE